MFNPKLATVNRNPAHSDDKCPLKKPGGRTSAGGARVWICAAWVNRKGQAGPRSSPVSTHIQGGGVDIVSGMKRAA